MRLSTLLRRPVTTLAVASTALTVLSGCAGTVVMTPAAQAKSADCARVSVKLPDSIGGGPDGASGASSPELARRSTTAQATGAWGDPASVLLWCGVEAPTASTLPCVTIDGVDWLIDESEAPSYRFTTFGREPSVSVVVDSSRVSGSTAITDLSQAVSVTTIVNRCLGAQ